MTLLVVVSGRGPGLTPDPKAVAPAESLPEQKPSIYSNKENDTFSSVHLSNVEYYFADGSYGGDKSRRIRECAQRECAHLVMSGFFNNARDTPAEMCN